MLDLNLTKTVKEVEVITTADYSFESFKSKFEKNINEYELVWNEQDDLVVNDTVTGYMMTFKLKQWSKEDLPK